MELVDCLVKQHSSKGGLPAGRIRSEGFHQTNIVV